MDERIMFSSLFLNNLLILAAVTNVVFGEWTV